MGSTSSRPSSQIGRSVMNIPLSTQRYLLSALKDTEDLFERPVCIYEVYSYLKVNSTLSNEFDKL